MNDVEKNQDPELEALVKRTEENTLFALEQAENGDEELKRILDEQLTVDVIVLCKDEIVMRVVQYYCLSIETANKAFQICEWMPDHNRWDLSEIKDIYMLSAAIPTAETYLEKSNPTVIKGRAAIKVCAENGYALGQYWMGRLAEDGNDYALAGGFDKDANALRWYRKAADQGLAAAKKRVAELIADAKKYGRCPHCFGEFKGLFKKVCRKCGKPKDY